MSNSERTDSLNVSCVIPSSLSSVLGLSENCIAKWRSKSMRSWAYFCLSNSYYSYYQARIARRLTCDLLFWEVRYPPILGEHIPSSTLIRTCNMNARHKVETRVCNLPRLCESFMLAFIPWPILWSEQFHGWCRISIHTPALGECVWHASPAMKMRSWTENWDATRCPTRNGDESH